MSRATNPMATPKTRRGSTPTIDRGATAIARADRVISAGRSPFRFRRKELFIGGFLVMVVVAVFSRSLKGEFTTFDDLKNLTSNPFLNPPTWRSIAHTWSSTYDELYIPLTHT